ncbi:MAG: hypothetical protein AAB662_03805 [Patescibacteria group bacterium]
MFNGEVYRKQHAFRLVGAVIDGGKDQVAPNEYIKRIIQSAIRVRNPLIKDGDPFVVLGNDGLDRSWFPIVSFKTEKDALSHVKRKQDEEPEYSDGNDASTTFHVFTREGVHIRKEEG